jgi:hypothetical protein
MSGPGTVYEATDLPNGLLLRFIIQNQTSLETAIKIAEVNNPHSATLAIPALAIFKANYQPIPDPPYPRPQAYSLSELVEILSPLRFIMVNVYEAWGAGKVL